MWKKYKDKQTGREIEARLTKLHLVENDRIALGDKGADKGAVMEIKTPFDHCVFWKLSVFDKHFEECPQNVRKKS